MVSFRLAAVANAHQEAEDLRRQMFNSGIIIKIQATLQDDDWNIQQSVLGAIVGLAVYGKFTDYWQMQVFTDWQTIYVVKS